MRNYFNINSITQLSEVVETLKKITLWIDVTTLSRPLIAELTAAIKHSKGKTPIHMVIYDPQEGVSINMHTKKLRVTFNDELRQFFEKNNIKYALI